MASLRMLSTQVEGNFTAVRAAATLNVPADRAFELLSKLETTAPPVLIDTVRMVARHGGRIAPRADPRATPLMEVTLAARVYAPSQPRSEGETRR
jgi:type II secretion system (T2SS) protein M